MITTDHSLNFLCKRHNSVPLPVSMHFSKISTSMAASSQKNLIILLMQLSSAHMPLVSQSPLPYSYLSPRSVPSELPWRYLQCQSYHGRASVSAWVEACSAIANIAFARSLPPSLPLSQGGQVPETLREPG